MGGAKRGISLKFDDDGKATAVAPVAGELCNGIVICTHCKGEMCHAVPDPIRANSWDLKACPLKKWVTLWHAPGHGEGRISDYREGVCALCESKTFWRLNEKGPWTCFECYPPSAHKKYEKKTVE